MTLPSLALWERTMQSPFLHRDLTFIGYSKGRNEEQERESDIAQAKIEIENVKMSSKVVASGWF